MVDFNKLMQGASKLDDVKAEMWRPEKRGETLVGRLAKIEASKYGDIAVFEPVILTKADGSSEVYADYRLGLNFSLKNRITRGSTGKVFAVTLKGYLDTPAGPGREYNVAVVSNTSAFAAEVRDGSKGAVTDVHDATRSQSAGDDEDDDLPF